MPTGFDDTHVNHPRPDRVGVVDAILRRQETRRVANLDLLVRLKQGANPAGGEHKGTEDIPTLKGLILEAHEEIKQLRAEKMAFLLHLKESVRFTGFAMEGRKAPRKDVSTHLKAVEAILKGFSGG